MFRCLLRNKCQVLGFEVDLLLIFRCTSSVSYHWQIRELIQSKLHAKMLLMRIFLLSNVPAKWKLLPHFLNCPSDGGSVV